MNDELRKCAKQRSYRMGNVSGGLDTRSEYYEACLLDCMEMAFKAGSEESSRKPWLGNATTRELFEELMARVGDANLEYKTTETDEERKKRFSLRTQDDAAEIRKLGAE